MSILPQNFESENSQSQGAARNQRRQQLELFNNKCYTKSSRIKKDFAVALSEKPKPAISAKLAPASHHRSKADRYWIICNHVGKPFGGLYYKVEVEFIRAYFTGRTGLVEPSEFGRIANRAINYFTQKEGV